MHRFLSTFVCCLPWAIRSGVFGIFEKKISLILNFLQIFLALLDYVSKATEIEIRPSVRGAPSPRSIVVRAVWEARVRSPTS